MLLIVSVLSSSGFHYEISAIIISMSHCFILFVFVVFIHSNVDHSFLCTPFYGRWMYTRGRLLTYNNFKDYDNGHVKLSNNVRNSLL